MVTVTITLERKQKHWHVGAYEAAFADGIIPPPMPAPPTRKFPTPMAASKFVVGWS
ncbi:MAG: hypothetical protein H0X01_02585 [Nitrospira sp.]|nr:hypothetical protein [Nitrospira sp.]